MMAYVTSIGEPTTELCVWSLERQGFTVKLIQSKSSLAEKLQEIYRDADHDFIRVDADVIVNRNVINLGEYHPRAWWVQGMCYGWYSQALIHGGVQLIRAKAIPTLRQNIGQHLNDERPETSMSRLPEFYDPRRFESADIVCGLHGWGQNDLRRVMEQKARRGQTENYDFEMVKRMAEL